MNQEIHDLAEQIILDALYPKQIKKAAERIMELNAKSDWTPCAEGMPTHCREYRVTVVDTRCGARFSRSMDYNIHTEAWTDERANELPNCYTVVAWMDLPAPYRAGDTTGKVKEDADGD